VCEAAADPPGGRTDGNQDMAYLALPAGVAGDRGREVAPVLRLGGSQLGQQCRRPRFGVLAHQGNSQSYVL
jgi:hypothetical protein